MRRLKNLLLITGLAFVTVAVIAPASSADETNQETKITFTQPVQVPKQVLPAGTYWFRSHNSNNGADTVEIFNSDKTHVICQLATKAVSPTDGFGQEATIKGVHWPTGKIVMTFAEGGKQAPATLLDWYYPEGTYGHKFVYGDQREKQLKEENQKTVTIEQGGSVTFDAH